jgi:hypothetical protein
MVNLAATYHKLGKYQEAQELQAQHEELVSNKNFIVIFSYSIEDFTVGNILVFVNTFIHLIG